MRPAPAKIERTGPARRCARALLCLAVLLTAAVPARAAEPVLAGTSLIADIASDLGRGAFSVRTLIPGSTCPGHADLRASDVAFAGAARAVIIHDWQRNMPMLHALRRSAPTVGSRLHDVAIPGDWMVPERQAAATVAIAKILEGIASPSQAAAIAARAQKRLVRIRTLAAWLKKRAAPLRGTRVLCDAMQRPLLEWFGCVVVAQYGRFEDMNPRQLAAAVARAKTEKARLVVDNLQSTGGSGKALADELGAGYAALTSFPGVDRGASTWEQAVVWNLNRLLAGAGKRR